MAISEELNRIINAKADIKTAIENKGITVGDDLIDTYASKIDAIPTGGGGSGSIVDGVTVKFWDFKGNLLKTETINKGEDATPPTPPEYEYLTFDRWNVDYTNVQRDLHIGALYRTTEANSTYFFVKTTDANKTFAFNQFDTVGLYTVDWGDGNTDTIEVTDYGDIISHTYTEVGDYTITFSSTFDWGCRIVYNSLQPYMCYVGDNMKITTYYRNFFGGQSSGSSNLKFISLRHNITDPIFSLEKLEFLVFPNSSVNISLNYCYELRGFVSVIIEGGSQTNFNSCAKILDAINISETYSIGGNSNGLFRDTSFRVPNPITFTGDTTIKNDFMNNAMGITDVILTQSGLGISSGAFQTNSLNSIEFLSTTPPSISYGVFSQFSSNLTFKIFVPDGSVEAYKTATNWTQWASAIYPVSRKGEFI